MGATTEVVVQVASTVAGASAVWAALAKSLSDWLKQRRSDVSIEITLPGGEHVSVSGSRLDDPEAIIQMAFDKALEASRPAAEDE
jgi:uncharacterized protein YajQ (UPF0234 family)